ncbi:MAG: ABC transporter ATP-binding protein [Bacillota bacterium]|nr:ABC transporter ATP-binding protein [Bacillota bacterium]
MKKNKSNRNFIKEAFRVKLASLALLFILNSFAKIITLWIPIITGDLIDFLTHYAKTDEVYLKLTILFFSSAMLLLIQALVRIHTVSLQTDIGYHIYFFLIERIYRLKGKYDDINSKYLNQRIISDCNQFVTFVVDSSFSLISNLLSIALVLIMIHRIDTKISIYQILAFPLYFIMYIKSKKKIAKMHTINREANSTLFSKIQQRLDFKKTVFAIGKTDYILSQNRQDQLLAKSKLMQLTKASVIFNQIGGSISLLLSTLVLIRLIFLVSTNEISIGTFTVVNSFNVMLMGNYSYLLAFIDQLLSGKVSYRRLVEVSEFEVYMDGTEVQNELKQIDLIDVSFKYNWMNRLNEDLFNLTRHFLLNRMYAVVGNNGDGKSTLLEVILGLKQGEYSGDIFINGKNIKRIDMELFRREEVTYIDQRLRVVDIELDFDDDCFFSEGEKQMFALESNLKAAKRLVICDEPTAFLDHSNKNKAIALLMKNRPGRIIIVATHDRDLIQLCDEVIQL